MKRKPLNMLKCVTIDDEPLARECIANYISDIDFLELTASGRNPIELIRILGEQQVDLLFLDIQMPVMNGIEFLEMQQKLPMVIITTAYPNYALEGYQLDILDYLVKPITFTRFLKATTKARDYHQLLNNSTTRNPVISEPDYFFVKCDYKYEKICFNDILYVEAMQNYVTIYTEKGKYITLLYLKNVEEKLDKQSFIRVHKSYIVSIPKIEAIENNEIIMRSSRIPVSRNYYDQVLEKVVNERLWRK